MDIRRSSFRLSSAQKYVVCAGATGLGLFGLLRLPWVESHLVLPLTRMQGALAATSFNTPAAPISVTLACSGTEVIAMCLGAILAYPTSWRSRMTGAVMIVLGILGLNTIRIGTLGLAATSPQWFNALHLYLWPAVLVIATAGAVFVWMRHADRTLTTTLSPSWRFFGLALGLLTLSAITAPFYIDSVAVHRVGVVIAHAASAALYATGAGTYATDNVLWTTRGGFSVTGDCVATPLLPLYLAAVWIYGATWPTRVLGTVLALPVFVALGVVRLLLVALPQSMSSVPEFATHTFYQVVLACIVVGVAARWRHGGRAWGWPVAAGLAAAVVCLAVAGHVYSSVVLALVDRPLLDPQGALELLPSFQLALFLALCVAAGQGIARTTLAFGWVLLVGSHMGIAWSLNTPAVPLLLANAVSAVRAWALAGPLLIFALMQRRSREAVAVKSVQNSTVSPVPPPVA